MSSIITENISRLTDSAVRPFFVGVNVGKEIQQIGIIDSAGSLIGYFDVPNYAINGPDDSLNHLAASLSESFDRTGLTRGDVVALGYSFPGTIDPKTELLRRPPNFPDWYGYPIVQKLNEYTGIKTIYFVNNANAAAFAEYWVGAAQATSSSCTLWIGTGVGCGIIINGQELVGANGYGGEFGHTLIDSSPTARYCNCMHQGHLEAYCGAAGVRRRTKELLECQVPSFLSDSIVHQDTPVAVFQKVVDAAAGGDHLAERIIDTTAHFLALGIVNLIHTIDPECILIGGEIDFHGKDSKIGTLFLDLIRKNIKERTVGNLGEILKLDYASLGQYAPVIGAAGLAKEQDALLSVVEDRAR